MKKRWSANTWVVVILFTIIGLISIDIGRTLLKGSQEAQNDLPTSESVEPSFKVGDKAPDFTLANHKGTPQTLSKLVKNDTMLWFTCGCSNCLEMQTYMSKLSKQLGPKAPEVINVTTMMPEREETWYRDTQLKQTILYQKSGDKGLEKIYHGHPCPRFFRLKPDRTVTLIGSSPKTLPDMNLIGVELANNLGFQVKGDKPKKGDKQVAGKLVAPAPNFPPPGFTAPPPQAAAGHEAGGHEGHNH